MGMLNLGDKIKFSKDARKIIAELFEIAYLLIITMSEIAKASKTHYLSNAVAF